MSPIRVRFSLSGIYYIVNYETLFSAGLLRNTGIFLVKNPYAEPVGFRNVPQKPCLRRVS